MLFPVIFLCLMNMAMCWNEYAIFLVSLARNSLVPKSEVAAKPPSHRCGMTDGPSEWCCCRCCLGSGGLGPLSVVLSFWVSVTGSMWLVSWWWTLKIYARGLWGARWRGRVYSHSCLLLHPSVRPMTHRMGFHSGWVVHWWNRAAMNWTWQLVLGGCCLLLYWRLLGFGGCIWGSQKQVYSQVLTIGDGVWERSDDWNGPSLRLIVSHPSKFMGFRQAAVLAPVSFFLGENLLHSITRIATYQCSALCHLQLLRCILLNRCLVHLL